MLHQVWQASQARSGMRSGKRSPVFVYLDEFQDLLRLPLALGEALVQARGLGSGWCWHTSISDNSAQRCGQQCWPTQAVGWCLDWTTTTPCS